MSQGLGWAYGSVPLNNGKTCYVAPIQIRDENDVILKSFWVHVIVSQSNRHVITAYPNTTGIQC